VVRVVVGFLVDFRIFGFFGFEDLFRPADQGNHSQHPCDAVGRLGDTSGAQSWPDFSTFLARMVVGFLIDFRIFGILGFEERFGPADQDNHSQHPGDGF
jgi:hypothetical protein